MGIVEFGGLGFFAPLGTAGGGAAGGGGGFGGRGRGDERES